MTAAKDGLRVVLFSHRLADTSPTGILRYNAELVKALATTQTNGVPLRYEVCSTREDRRPGWVPAAMGVRDVRGPRRVVHLSWATLRAPTIERLSGPIDLLHVTTPVVPVPTRAPLVVTIHDLLPLHHPEWYLPRERWLNGSIFAQAAREAAAIIAPSQVVADDIVTTLRVDKSRVTVIAEGVDQTLLQPPPPAAVADACARYGVEVRSFVLFVGAVGPRKNVGTVLEAVAASRAEHPRLRLLAVGPLSEASAPTMQHAARLGFDEVATFPGFVSDDDLRLLLAGALALVHPATYEGFGLTPLEAMAAGTPVISSDAGSLPEVVGDAGLLVGPANSEAWAYAITRVAADQDLRDQLIEAGRARACMFTWSRAAERTAAVYRRCLSR